MRLAARRSSLMVAGRLGLAEGAGARGVFRRIIFIFIVSVVVIVLVFIVLIIFIIRGPRLIPFEPPFEVIKSIRNEIKTVF